MRILRVARFAARFPSFKVAPETAELMREMVRNGEADALVPERVMQEISRGLMETKPSQMLNVLVSCGLIDRLFAELEDLGPTSAALDRAAQPNWYCRRALQFWRRVPIIARGVRLSGQAARTARCSTAGAATGRAARATEKRRNLGRDRRGARRSDAFRRPERFEWLLRAFEAAADASAERFRRAQRVASEVDAGALASLHRNDPSQIQRAVRKARVVAVGRELRGPPTLDQQRQ